MTCSFFVPFHLVPVLFLCQARFQSASPASSTTEGRPCANTMAFGTFAIAMIRGAPPFAPHHPVAKACDASDHQPVRPRCGAPAHRQCQPDDPERHQGRVGRPQWSGKIDLVPGDHRRSRRRNRLGLVPEEHSPRSGRAGSARHGRIADRDRSQGRRRARVTARGGRDRDGSDPDFRHPCTARRHRGPFGRGARIGDPVWPRLRHGRAGPPGLVLLGRLAHACGARGCLVRAARPSAPRRADQLSRSGRHAVAGEFRFSLSLHRACDQP